MEVNPLKKKKSPAKNRGKFPWIGMMIGLILVLAIGVVAVKLLTGRSVAPPVTPPAPVRVKIPTMHTPVPKQQPQKGAEKIVAQSRPLQRPQAVAPKPKVIVQQVPSTSEQAAPEKDAAITSQPGQGDATKDHMPKGSPIIESKATQPESEAETREPRQSSKPEPKDQLAAQPSQPAVEPKPAPHATSLERGPVPARPTQAENRFAPNSEKQAVSPASPAAPAPIKLEPEKAASYTIQVGAYRTKEYADNKLVQLKKRGYDPFVFQTTDSKQRSWYTVRFGRFESRDEAVVSLSEFKQKEKMTAILALANKL